MAFHDMRVFGVFPSSENAQHAIDELHDAGFTEDEISILSHNLQLVGSGTGFGAALSRMFSGGMETEQRDVRRSLIDLGLGDDEARRYDDYIGNEGAIIVIDSSRSDQALDILRRHGAVNSPGSERMTGTRSAEPRTGDRPSETITRPEDEQTVKLREEKLHVEKRPETIGEVRVGKEVVTEHQTQDVPVEHEEVVVSRRKVAPGETADTGQVEIGEGEEIRIPVRGEKVEVEKRPEVREEVTISKRKVQDTQRVEDTVKREELDVEKEGQIRERAKQGEKKPISRKPEDKGLDPDVGLNR